MPKKNAPLTRQKQRSLALLTLLLLSLPWVAPSMKAQSLVGGKDIQTAVLTSSATNSSLLSQWWNSTNAWDELFGLDPLMRVYGLTVTGSAKEGFYGVLGGLPSQPKGSFLNEEKLNLLVDFGKLFGLEGLAFSSTWRYRNLQNNPSYAAGTPTYFDPCSDFTGLGMRILPQYFEYTTPSKNITINAGWENPYELFLQQPLSKYFENTEINALKGIGAPAGPGIIVVNPANGASMAYRTSAVPWISSYASWGGTLKVKPSSTTYIQCGLYTAIANEVGILPTQFTATSVYPYTSVPQSYLGQLKSSGQIVPIVGANGHPIPGKYQNIGFIPATQNNHGFNFQGSPYFQPNINAIGVTGQDYGNGGNYSADGIYTVNEIGWTPKLGSQKLEGKYVIGGYLWGQQNNSFTPVSFSEGAKKPYPSQLNQVIWGLYIQADQKLFAPQEHTASFPDGKTGPVKATEKGLYSFNEMSFTPPQNNQMPYYFQTGLVYKGLLPGRDHDATGIALGTSFYSSYYNAYIQSQNQTLENAYGSPYNATVPNGPVSQPVVNAETGKPSETKTYWAYQPTFSTTEVIEGFYNIQINKWAAIKPFAQYIVNPAGNGTVANTWVLGITTKVTF